jgi:hypothetical protein
LKENTMAELPEGITQKQIDEYAKLDKGIKKLQTRHKILNALIKQVFEGTPKGTKIFGEVVVKLGETSTFSSESFEEKYPKDKFPQYYKLTLDPKTIEADVKAKFTSNNPTLSVSVAD